MKFICCILGCLLLICNTIAAQVEIPLYKNGPKESNGILARESMDQYNFLNGISVPRMYAYPAPEKISTGAAVLICPGGSYRGVSTDKEGTEVAAWFNKLGVSAFILYYRMPNAHYAIPLKDAQAAMRIIRKGAGKWHLNNHKIGIIGFSAGGHLASTAGTRFTKKTRPDFMILAYPVISMKKEITHAGSRHNLLGLNPSEKLINQYSNELHISRRTPPTFLVAASDDEVVPVQNSLLFYKALQAKNVIAGIHIYDIGGHGFGMRKRGLLIDNWPVLMQEWLQQIKIIN